MKCRVSIGLKAGVKAAVAFGILAAALPAGIARAQTVPETPSWQAPAGFSDEGDKPASGKGAKGKAARSAKTQPRAKVGGGYEAPMRKIDRDDIDMTGVGTVREGPAGFRPQMQKGGGMGFGGAF